MCAEAHSDVARCEAARTLPYRSGAAALGQPRIEQTPSVIYGGFFRDRDANELKSHWLAIGSLALWSRSL